MPEVGTAQRRKLWHREGNSLAQNHTAADGRQGSNPAWALPEPVWLNHWAEPPLTNKQLKHLPGTPGEKKYFLERRVYLTLLTRITKAIGHV